MFILDNAILSEMQVSFLSGIYSFVIKVYDIMLDLIESSNLDLSKFESIATVMYVLAGVFILFKVIIAMIQMILNPDTISDKQAGAGGLIKRIVICLILLIAFAPNGFIFGHEGIFKRIETALLKENGLINNITKAGTNLESTKEPFYGYRSYYASDILIENVYAAETFSCYYYRIDKVEAEDVVIPGANNQKVTVNKIYKITFKVGGNQGDYQKAYDSENIYYKQSTGTIGNGQYVDSSGNSASYSQLGYPIKANSEIKNGKCPSAMFYKKNKQYWNAESDVAQKLKEGLHGGETTLEGLQESLKELRRKNGINRIISNNGFVTEGIDLSKTKYLDGVRPSSIDFGQAVASSMQDCAVNSIPDCVAAQDKMFESPEDNDRVVDLVKEDKLETGFFISIVVGIILVIYLLFLSVEVIIRRLKLFFLEVIAPIPIISYVDPKDQKLNTWFKMYFSTYLDLFIKLIAIKLAIVLLEIICEDFSSPGNSALGLLGNALTKFFYIVAILIFAKILPTMISKILNLDSLGGSFKDIMGMAKGVTRAGMGVAGAAVGAGAGMLAMGAGIAAARKNGWKGMLGAGVQGLGNVVSGAARGAGSGWNRNITGGASNVLATGKKQRDARDQGATMFGTMAARATNALGFDDAYEKRKKALDKEREDLKALQNSQNADKRKMGLIDQFEDKVVSNFDTGKYDHLAAVDAYNRAVSHVDSVKAKERLIGTMMKDSNGNDVKYTAEMYENELTSARTSANSMKGQALDAAKDYEIKNGSDTKAQELVGLIGTGSWKEMDQEKKSLTKSTINRGQEISISEERIATAELELENSSSKFNHEAANRNSNN